MVEQSATQRGSEAHVCHLLELKNSFNMGPPLGPWFIPASLDIS